MIGNQAIEKRVAHAVHPFPGPTDARAELRVGEVCAVAEYVNVRAPVNRVDLHPRDVLQPRRPGEFGRLNRAPRLVVVAHGDQLRVPRPGDGNDLRRGQRAVGVHGVNVQICKAHLLSPFSRLSSISRTLSTAPA